MSPIDTHILDEAAQWLARWHASDFGESERAELARWRSQSAMHEDVWQRAKQLTLQMRNVPSSVGMRVLDRPRSAARRQTLRAAALVLAAPALGWLSYRYMPWQVWGADIKTATGQARVITLADQSQVQLNTASAISVSFDGAARRIQQYAGEIFVETSHATEYKALPFIVQTEDGQMQALGTTFNVRKHEHGTTLSVLQGAVRITPAHTTQSVILQAGEQTRFNALQVGSVTRLPPHADAWRRGVLYAENMRLDDLLTELGRYREGVLLCDAEVAGLQVSGTYQLHDTDRILDLLTQTHPVRKITRTRYWVTITSA